MSDFGLEDYYVGSVKAVVKRICPQSEVIDITHMISPWSLLEGDYILSCCYDDFPEGTVFLIVVDPGVGTERRVLVAKTDKYWFVSPDNGVLEGVLEKSPSYRLWHVVKPPVTFKHSFTFHGRDVFGPVAAYLACGGSIEEIGRASEEYVHLNRPNTSITESGIRGYVAHVDRFGNIATSIDKGLLATAGISYNSRLLISLGLKHFEVGLYRTFAEVDENELVALINSCGKLELAVNKGRASDRLKVKVGDPLEVKLIKA